MKRIIVITGMAGAGKAAASAVAREVGWPIFVCGDVIREETRSRGLPAIPENIGKIMLRIREEQGPTVVAERLTPLITRSDAQIVVVEGVRSLEEIDELRRNFGNVTIIALHACPSTRFDRLRERGRSDDPQSWDEFRARDMRELEVGIGQVIALADEVIVNERTIDELVDRVRTTIWEILNAKSDSGFC